MDNHINVLNQVFPFFDLKKTEKQELIKHSNYVEYHKDAVIYKVGVDDSINELFLLLSGSVSVFMDNELVGKIESPSYFGERAAFFHQPRRATIVSNNNVACLIVDAEPYHQSP